MDASTATLDAPTVGKGPPTPTACDVYAAIFKPNDLVLYRPIETWTDPATNGKCHRVDYKGITYVRNDPAVLGAIARQQLKRSETERTNIFYGVCPRFGAGGQYDQAWQIRVVRALWSDIDHCTVDEARERCKAAGLPEPSITVASGHGVHLYWLLAEAYPIDDVGDPPPVLREFIDQGEGKKKKCRLYLKEEGSEERLYLDIKSNVPPLSTKAQTIQDILKGIAAKIGGDHTTDLSRLLRVPGTLNRKDERNGREPVPCVLVECHPERRYPIDVFMELAKESPDKKQREQVAQVKLPTPRKLSPNRQDALYDLVLACKNAKVGDRSGADWQLCTWAIEHGATRDVVWREVADVGKFGERGQAYFDRTWQRAEQHTRQKIFENAQKKADAKAEKKDKGDDGEVGVVKLLADAIQKDNHFAQDAGGKLYRYTGGVYKPKAEESVKAQVKRLCVAWNLTDEWSSRLAAEVVEFIRVDSPQLWERPRVDVVNVKNGLVRVADGVLLPHTPEHLSPVQLPVEHDPAATCPAIDKFVSEVFPPDAIDLAFQVPGLLMVPYTSLQLAILLLGEGANGKSRWLALLVSFLGKGNTAGVSLHKLEADKFSVSRLIGKLANICPDLPSEHLAGTSTFKALTGGDTLTAEYKFRDSFDIVPFARLVFSANHPPRSADASHAFFRRWKVIQFNRTFAPTEQIPAEVLDARLSAPSELSGLLNKALVGLRRVQEHGLADPASVQTAWSEFHATTDPLAVWLEKYTVDDPNGVTVMSVLRASYNAAADREGRPTLNKSAFGTALKRLRPAVEEKQRTVNQKVQWCYVGIGMFSADSESSHTSRTSRTFPLIPHARNTDSDWGGNGTDHWEQDRAKSVNSVNSVKRTHPQAVALNTTDEEPPEEYL